MQESETIGEINMVSQKAEEVGSRSWMDGLAFYGCKNSFSVGEKKDNTGPRRSMD